METAESVGSGSGADVHSPAFCDAELELILPLIPHGAARSRFTALRLTL
jgi:hypothetical protein